jgi:uncharacterized membrane protein
MTIATPLAFPMLAASSMPVVLEYLSWWEALALFGLVSAIVLGLGVVALNGLTPVRRWVTLGLRLAVVAVLVLIIGGARWRRTSKDLEVMILRDVSPSVQNSDTYPGPTLQASIEGYITAAGNRKRPVDDKYGEIRFDQVPLIESLPSSSPMASGGPIRDNGTGTDIAAAIQLGLATFDKDSMRRLVLISDGNPTAGDTEAAIDAAAAQHVPIDVMPLHYDIKHEVAMERFVAPTWKREHEPFTLNVVLKNTNDVAVTGKLTVTDGGVPMTMYRRKEVPDEMFARMPRKTGAANDAARTETIGDETVEADAAPRVTLTAGSSDQPSLNRIVVHIGKFGDPASGVHEFHANFTPDDSAVGKVDTMTTNNGGDAFTYVRGKGRVLYVDNVDPINTARGQILLGALRHEGIAIDDSDHIKPSQFPVDLIQLQNFDAIILANVPYGDGGLSETQQANLATYVHDMGGGLVMIGGDKAYGVGGWQGKKLADVLPVTMDIPAKRTIAKGALVLAMDPAEMDGGQGNLWGEQCAIKAMETLSAQDDIGIISYGPGGCRWDLPLGPKGDGSAAKTAIKNWYLGDLPSFEDAITLALDGNGTSKGLIDDDAAQKHIIVITDDDPTMPSQATIQRCRAAHITVSTITVFPHIPHNIAPGTIELADRTGGRHFGPIEDNPSQLPQLFVKEATIVRRSLIHESREGIRVYSTNTGLDMAAGITGNLPVVYGMVLTGARATNPLVRYPLLAGVERDPLLATWQTGLGKVACYMSDADNKWDAPWVASTLYTKFWAQVVKAVEKPPMSTQFSIDVTSNGNRGHIVVEGTAKDDSYLDFSTIHGTVMRPDGTPIDEKLVQTGPGRYEGDFDMPDAGSYVTVMHYDSPNGEHGDLPVGGTSQGESAEMRDLHSNDDLLEHIRQRTGGRLLRPFDADAAGFFDHSDLDPAESTLPVWDRLIPLLLALILLDVAARRIAWDWVAMKKYAAFSAGYVRSFTTVRQVETRGAMEALTRVRSEAAAKPAAVMPPARPDPKAKFTAKGVEGDIGNLVGGATDKPIPPPPKTVAPKGAAPVGGGMSALMEAKRRAQQRIKDQEQG